ncbi:response regulator [Luteitalea sp. TBR-22]|uniref:response regulator transcription factor n=1 Tax=Luteitalea sp. TBR-22 TaxID=2802971 RepID=UPI001EF55DE5
MRRAVAMLLRSHGHDVHAFPSAEACLAAPTVADCAIVDLTLPGRSGLDLVADLAARSMSLPVVFITGRAEIEVLQAARRAGHALVRKPVDEGELIRAIASATSRG